MEKMKTKMKMKMKRARDGDDESEPRSPENSNNNYIINHHAKKRDLHGINLAKDQNQQKDDAESEKASSQQPWDSHLALGVFDFPWLKDGVMSKTEDYFSDFEDKFSSSLEHHHHHHHQEDDGFHFSESYCHCETPESSKLVMETVWQPFEGDGLEIKAEDVDCIWSSLLNNNNHEGKILM